MPAKASPPAHNDVEKTTVAVGEKNSAGMEVNSLDQSSDSGDAAKVYVPDEDEELIDPRLKDYPIPLVAKTVDLHNDFRSVCFTYFFSTAHCRDSLRDA